MKPLVSALVCFTTLSGASEVFAEKPPPACHTTAVTTRAYQAGVNQGKALVGRVWLGVNKCDKLEAFASLVKENVSGYTLTGSSAYNICRHTGLVDGVFQQLDAVWQSCNGQCCQEGAVIGELAAKLYCDLSILLGGLAAPDEFVRRPVFLCGAQFETCCDDRFTSTSKAYIGLDTLGQQQCLPYTAGKYFDVWNGTRKLQCAYTPPTPPQPGPNPSGP
jgi:hypothetical protein